MLLNKINLSYLRFDVERCVAAAREVNPRIEFLLVSAQTGEGMQEGYNWLERKRARSAADGADEPVYNRGDKTAAIHATPI